MNNEALENVVKIQTESSSDVHLVGDILETDGKLNTLNVMEKAQRLEHDERKLRLEEQKQRLEAEKFEYQKKQDRKSFWFKAAEIAVNALSGGAKIFEAGVKLHQTNVMEKTLYEGYHIDQIQGNLTTGTGRTVQKLLENPKI